MTDKFAPIQKKNFCLRIYTVLIFSIALIYSCKDDPTDLGSDLIPGYTNPNISIDTMTMVLSENFFTDSMVVQDFARYLTDTAKKDTAYYATLQFCLFGEYKDDVFGKFSSEIAFELTPDAYQEIKSTYVVQSLKLYLEKTRDTVLIGSGDVISYDLYELSDTFGKPSASLLFSNEVDLSRYKGSYVGTGDLDTSGDSLVFEITNTVLINKLRNSTFTNGSSFRKNVLKGFYIVPKANYSNGNVSVLNFGSEGSRLELAYKMTASDTITYTNSYKINDFPRVIPSYKRDFTNVTFDTTNYIYLEGIAGKYARFSLPNLERLRSLNPAAILKAELILEPDHNMLSPKGVSYKEFPKQFDLMFQSEDGKEYYNIDGNSLGDNFFGGFYYKNKFTFNLTRYIQRYIKQSDTENLKMILKVRNSYARSNSGNYNSNIGYFDLGRVAFKKDRIKLRVTYSKL